MTAPDPTVQHTYAAAGTYTVMLTVTDDLGQQDTETQTITVVAAQPPVAAFTMRINANRSVDVNAGGSYDLDGTIVSYDWVYEYANNSGSNGTATGQTATINTALILDTITVTLTVTDNNGLTDSDTQSIDVTNAPIPLFTGTVALDVLTVDGSTSYDPDGPLITNWNWIFGDSTPGETTIVPIHTHTYAKSGRFWVSLGVESLPGDFSANTYQLAFNFYPIAAFTWVPTDLLVTVDPSTSTTFDGDLLSTVSAIYVWDFGDGTALVTASDAYPQTHTYAAAGTYPVTLIVTDNFGTASTPVTQNVTVASASTITADFIYTPSDLTLFLTDMSSTTAPPILSWLWDVGDGTTYTTQYPMHVYAAYGTYDVSLTATDVNGSDTEVKQVTMTQPVNPPVAVFTATVDATGMTVNVDGTASYDPEATPIETWTWDWDKPVPLSAINVKDGWDARLYARVGTPLTIEVVDTIGNVIPIADLQSLDWGDGTAVESPVTTLTHIYSMDSSTETFSIIATDSNNTTAQRDMKVVPVDDFWFIYTEGVNNYTNIVGVPVKLTITRDGVPVTTAEIDSVDWKDGTRQSGDEILPDGGMVHTFTVPKTWFGVQVYTTLSVQSMSSIQVVAAATAQVTEVTNIPTASHTYTIPGTYLIELVVHSDGLDSLPTTQQVTVADPNVPPVALFTGTVVGTVATLDGSTSYDQVQTRSIVTYNWDFGDGSAVDTASGVTAIHDYALPGPYTATLTVTDDDGAVSIPVTHVVTLGGETWADTGDTVIWDTINPASSWTTVTPTDLMSEGSVI